MGGKIGWGVLRKDFIFKSSVDNKRLCKDGFMETATIITKCRCRGDGKLHYKRRPPVFHFLVLSSFNVIFEHIMSANLIFPRIIIV